MAHGTPVITSNASSLPEVVGKAAVLVNPENVFEIMRAIHRVLLDSALRTRLRERGYEQAKRFSWDNSARRILKAYKHVAGIREAEVSALEVPIEQSAAATDRGQSRS
jgi:glycosyltransferase involved in cell wall biosynthesis